MSRIAALLLLAAPGDKPPVSAADAMRAHARMTSIGPDPCRKGAPGSDEEIVVCGRREDPYALPLYDPTADDDASKAGGSREAAMETMKESAALCHARGEACLKPHLLVGTSIGPGKKGKVRVGED